MTTFKLNRILLLVLLLSLILLISLAVFLLSYHYPEIIGAPPAEYEVNKVFEFEPWRFNFHDKHINFPEGGYIFYLYHNDRMEGALFWGDANYYFPQQSLPEEEISGFLVVIEEDIIHSQKGEVIFSPADDYGKTRKMGSLMGKNPGLPKMEGAGIPLSFPPENDSFYLYFLNYHQEIVEPPVYQTEEKTPWLSGLMYFLIFIIFLLVIQLITLGNSPINNKKGLPDVTRKEFAIFLMILTMVFISHLMVIRLMVPEYYIAIGYLPGTITLYWLYRQSNLLNPQLGISKDTWKNGYLAAIIIAVLFLFLPFELAKGIHFISWKESLSHFLYVFFIMGLIHEIIWRGYIQSILSRMAGKHPGLLLTAFLAGMVQYSLVFFNTPEWLSYPYTIVDLAVMVPGTALVLGYLFQKTENVFCCALLHTLILFVPGYLIY